MKYAFLVVIMLMVAFACRLLAGFMLSGVEALDVVTSYLKPLCNPLLKCIGFIGKQIRNILLGAVMVSPRGARVWDEDGFGNPNGGGLI